MEMAMETGMAVTAESTMGGAPPAPPPGGTTRTGTSPHSNRRRRYLQHYVIQCIKLEISIRLGKCHKNRQIGIRHRY